MLSVPVYNLEGKEAKKVKLKGKFLAIEFNSALVHQVASSFRNNKRMPTAHTKTRSEVRGGGKKPWRQNGTGRARAGSIRSPLWRGGGITFGPRNIRNYKSKINKGAGKLALAMVIKSKAEDGELKIVESLAINNSKTKELAKTLANLGITRESVLMITAERSANLLRAGKNLPKLKIKQAKEVNALDLLNHRYAIIEETALDLLIKRITFK